VLPGRCSRVVDFHERGLQKGREQGPYLRPPTVGDLGADRLFAEYYVAIQLGWGKSLILRPPGDGAIQDAGYGLARISLQRTS
jgi:hypothetical protein